MWVDGPGKKRHGRLERRELWALSDPELNDYAGSSGAVGRLGRISGRYAGWSGGGR